MPPETIGPSLAIFHASLATYHLYRGEFKEAAETTGIPCFGRAASHLRAGELRKAVTNIAFGVFKFAVLASAYQELFYAVFSQKQPHPLPDNNELTLSSPILPEKVCHIWYNNNPESSLVVSEREVVALLDKNNDDLMREITENGIYQAYIECEEIRVVIGSPLDEQNEVENVAGACLLGNC